MPRGTVPLVSDLEARIDEALVIARTSEQGVREVGEMALDAARQARRAAEAAEASARAAVEAVQTPTRAARLEDGSGELRPAGPVSDGAPSPPQPAQEEGRMPPAPPARFEVRFQRFSERAERVSARLRELERVPV